MNKIELGWCVVLKDSLIQPTINIIATFQSPFLAQDFIDKCLPPENKDKFKVMSI